MTDLKKRRSKSCDGRTGLQIALQRASRWRVDALVRLPGDFKVGAVSENAWRGVLRRLPTQRTPRVLFDIDGCQISHESHYVNNAEG